MLNKKPRETHGYFGKTEYEAWRNMRQRCINPKTPNFHNYGGRGIKVCDRWFNSFTNFIEDMGDKPSSNHSLDRIDNNGNYTPENCRWATKVQQDSNRRTTRPITINGVTKPLHQWARESPIKYETIKGRIYKYGWSPEKAIELEA